MSSKSTNNQGRRTPLTLAQGKLSLSQSQPINKRSNVAAKTEHVPLQREQELRSKQQQQKQQQQQQQHKKEEEKKESVTTAASAAGPVPAAIIANIDNKESQQVAALNNGYNKNETKNGIVTSAAANGNESSANTQVIENKPERETRQNANKQPKEQEQQHINNGANTATKSAAAAVAPSPVQRKQQQQAAESKSPSTTIVKKPAEEKIEIKSQATIEVVEKAEELQKTQQQTAEQQEIIIPSSPVTKKKAAQISPHNAKKAAEQEPHAELLEKPMVVEEKQADKADKATAVTPTTSSSQKIVSKVTPVKKYSVTTIIEQNEIDISPQKENCHSKMPSVALVDNPNATSTPDKYLKSGWPQSFNTPEQGKSVPMRTLGISGRRSIHREWTEYENNTNFRGSYRRIKTDLDSTADTNTSLNVTVGSEPGNNSSWFSFSSRKRERPATNMEGVQEDIMSPPKRARFESLFNIMASPITALRSRFSKTTIHVNSSTIKSITEEQEEINVSMQEQESIQEVEDLSPLDVMESNQNTSRKELNNKEEENAKPADNASAEKPKDCDIVDLVGIDDDADIEIIEATDSSNTVAHKKRCNIM